MRSLGLDVDDRGQLVDRALEVGDLAGRDLQRVGGVVAREHDAVAVEDQAAVGRDRHDRDAVVLGLGVVVVVLDHLQVDEARQQQRERGEHDDAGDADAQLEVVQLALDVFRSVGMRMSEIGRFSSTFNAWRCGSSSRKVTTGHSAAATRLPAK